MYYYVIC